MTVLSKLDVKMFISIDITFKSAADDQSPIYSLKGETSYSDISL